MGTVWIRTLVALTLTLAPVTPPAGAAMTAFTGATVHPVSGPPIPQGTLLVDGSRIAAVGAEVRVPEQARVVDLTGKHLYPAFVHPASVLGLIEVASVPGTDDTTEMGQVNTNIRAEVAFHADSALLPVTVAGGVVTAHVVPRGGVFAGTSAVMRLDGWNWREMTLEAPVGMHIHYPDLVPREGGFFFSPRTPEEIEEERRKALEVLDETLASARAYAKAKRAAAAGEAPEPDPDPQLEALLPVLDGSLPVFLHAEEKTQIEGALDWAADQGLEQLVLVAGPDARYVADRLAAEQVPVILDGVLTLPRRSWEPYDAAYSAAGALHAAGVRFAIGDGGSRFGAANSRNLPFHAAMAAAFGLPREIALESVTLAPAEILGVDESLGSLEAGKEATFLVTDGDPLEIRTHIERVFQAGREVDLSRDRQRRLYERYDARPRP